jgi:hypothetical protein
VQSLSRTATLPAARSRVGNLPVATKTGIFLLLDKRKDLNNHLVADTKHVLLVVGVSGLLIALVSFACEIYGIKKCDALVGAANKPKGELGSDGRFNRRPRGIIRSINERFSTGITYPAGLVGCVLGPHASEVAAQPAQALFEETADKPGPPGELLRDVRCRRTGLQQVIFDGPIVESLFPKGKIR